MYVRKIEQRIQKLANMFPVILITGPRQSGKTTLVKKMFGHLPYFSFEDFEVRARARSDLVSFVNSCRDGAIFDEVQHVPDLLSQLQGVVDEEDVPGRFVVTGSQNFTITNAVSQSLAGRVGVVTLFPLSLSEVGYTGEWRKSAFKGFYPRLNRFDLDPVEYYRSYIKTYIERDVREIANIGELESFGRFLRLCAGRVGQLLNISSLALDAEITTATARRWLSALKASYLVFTVHPYHKNFNKRLMKSPKLYFYDTGIACSLLGIRSFEQLETFYNKGSLYENLVVADFVKAQENTGKYDSIYFWRDHHGIEIDLVAEWGGVLHAIEVKSSQTYREGLMKSIQKFYGLAPESKGYLVYNGELEGTVKGIQLVSLKNLEQKLFDE